MKNPLIVLTDCYGGRGGIAQYNRYLVRALSLLKEINNMSKKIFYLSIN